MADVISTQDTSFATGTATSQSSVLSLAQLRLVVFRDRHLDVSESSPSKRSACSATLATYSHPSCVFAISMAAMCCTPSRQNAMGRLGVGTNGGVEDVTLGSRVAPLFPFPPGTS
eukprot:scaffold310_cov335-Pavlova_lutheri.AAC.55